METLQKQRIESPLITCVTRKVDSFSFDGGMTPKEGVNKSGVECNVRNAITSAFSDENGTRFRQLNLVIELLPSNEGHYYRSEISVSGIYRAPADLDDDAFDREALSTGMPMQEALLKMSQLVECGGHFICHRLGSQFSPLPPHPLKTFLKRSYASHRFTRGSFQEGIP